MTSETPKRSGRPKGLPKTGGRKKGGLNKVTREAREAASQLVDDPAYRARLLADLRERKVAPAIEAMLWYYAKGKPKEIVEHRSPDGQPLSFTLKLGESSGSESA